MALGLLDNIGYQMIDIQNGVLRGSYEFVIFSHRH
jgi:hypothetical protein